MILTAHVPSPFISNGVGPALLSVPFREIHVVPYSVPFRSMKYSPAYMYMYIYCTCMLSN